MALTTKQRNKLPASAFVYHAGPRSSWKFPVPTKAQAAKAGISERQRLGIARNALSRAGQSKTSGSYSTVAKTVKTRTGSKVASVGGPRGTTSRAGYRRR